MIGIAALGSAVVQQRVRDQWIGWDANHGIDVLLGNPSATTAAWLQEQVSERIAPAASTGNGFDRRRSLANIRQDPRVQQIIDSINMRRKQRPGK